MEGLEFFIVNDHLWVNTDDGRSLQVTEGDTEFIQNLSSIIRERYPEAYKALAKEYQKCAINHNYFQFLIVRRFCKCNFGELDTTKIDFDKSGKFNFEKVKCPLRGECKFDGVVCMPKFNSQLSDAEMRVMRLVYDGMNKEEIAGQLFLSPHTVKNHVNSAYCKLGIHEKSEFIKYANENNLFK